MGKVTRAARWMRGRLSPGRAQRHHSKGSSQLLRAAEAERMMKRLQGGCGIGALVWLRVAALVVAACVAGRASVAQSLRLVPSTSRFAGDGTGNPTGDGPGTARNIPLNAPSYVAADTAGNVYISDTG